jgi:T5SS/PEP-CTERM-associated repeat protein
MGKNGAMKFPVSLIAGKPVFRPAARRVPFIAAGCAALYFGSAEAKADAFLWLGGPGEFSSWGNWRDVQNQTFNPPNANPLHRTPGASDIVAFPQDQGPFTVSIDTATVFGTAIFDRFDGSVVTLNITGTYQMGESQLANIRMTGDGTARSNNFLIYDSVLSGVRGEFSNLRIKHHPPLSVPALTLQNDATLVTSGLQEFTGMATLDTGRWTHTGIIPGGEVRVLNESSLTVREVNAADAPSTPKLTVSDRSTVDMDNIQARVDATGASSVTFKRAVLYSEPAFQIPASFSGPGTTLTVSDQLMVMGGPLQIKSGGRLQTVKLSHDQGAFSTESIDSGSAVNVTGLLDSGTLAAKSGGSAAVATARNSTLQAVDAGSSLTFNSLEFAAGGNISCQATAGGVISGGAISAGLGQGSIAVRNAGSRLTLSGNLEVANVQLNVEDGGRVDCALAAFGGGTFANATVTGANSFLLARRGMILGDRPGTMTLTVSAAGRVQTGLASEPGTSTAIGFIGGADGRLLINSGGVFDARLNAEAGVGVEAKGQVTVNTGGRLLASNLTLGSLAGGDGTVTGNGSSSSLEVQETLRVGGEGLGRLNLFSQFVTVANAVHVGDSSANNTLTVSGGSELRFANALTAGNKGRGLVRLTTGGIITGTGAQPLIGIGEESSAAAGTLEIDGAGSRVNGSGSGLILVGTTGQGTLLVSNGGAIDVAGGSVGGAGGSNGTATVTGAGSQWNLVKSLDVGGFSEAVPGTLTVANSAVVRVGKFMGITSAGVVTLNGGSINVGAGSAAAGMLRVGAGGVLKYGGRVTGGKVLQALGGVIQPGQSPGIARMEAGFEQEAGAVLEMEIAGVTAGTLYDQLIVTGSATLNGNLVVRFTNGYAPAQGQVFDLVTAGSVSGSFANVTIEGLQAGFQHQMRTMPDGRVQLVAQNAGVASTQPVEAKISIEYVNGLVAVSYPAELTGWILQASPDLATGAWSTVNAPGHRLTVVPGTGRRFFRLIKP